MTDIYRRAPLPVDVLDPNKTIAHWRSLEGREKSQQEINEERLNAWRVNYDALISIRNRRKYHQMSVVGGRTA